MAFQKLSLSPRQRNSGALWGCMFAGIAEGGEKLQLGDKVVGDGAAGVGLEPENLVEIGVLQRNLLRRICLVKG